MDELHDRFHRLDRMATPNLWSEAVGRAAELEAVRRRGFNPAMVLMAVALIMAAIAGTIAVGGWVNRPTPDPLSVTYDNGMVAVVGRCGTITGIDPDTAIMSGLVSADAPCGETWASSLAWSSDGRWMAYLASLPDSDLLGLGSSEVWLYDARSGSTSALLACDGCGDVDISPDGSLVTFVDWEAATAPRRELVVARTDGGAVHRAPFVGIPGRPQFSPDGRRIAMPITGGTSGIHLLDVSGLEEADATPALRLVHGPVAAWTVTWSPDGEWLAFDKLAAGNVSEIWVVRRDGSDARRLEFGLEPFGPASPVWSADSSAVAYLTTPSQAPGEPWSIELWTSDLSGESTRIYRSTCCLVDFSGPTWSPDGEWIAFGILTSDNPSGSGLYLVRPDGSDLHRLTAFAGVPAWQSLVAEPDSR
jgi:Tol biopolymer transport system component